MTNTFNFYKESSEIFNQIKAPNSFMNFIKLKTIDLSVDFYKKKYDISDDQNFSINQLNEILENINNPENTELKKFIISEIKNELSELIKILIKNDSSNQNDLIQSSEKISETFKKFNFFRNKEFIEFIENSSLYKLLMIKNSESEIADKILRIEVIFDIISKKLLDQDEIDKTLNKYIEIYIKSIEKCKEEIGDLNEIFKSHFENHEKGLEKILILSLYENFFFDIVVHLDHVLPDQQKYKFFEIENEKLKALGILFGQYPNLYLGEMQINEFLKFEAEKIFCFSKIDYKKILNNRNNEINNRIKIFKFLINIFNSKKDFLEFIQNNGSRKISYIFNAINNTKDIESKITQSKILKICELPIDILEKIDFEFFLKIYSLKNILFSEANNLILGEKILYLYDLYIKDSDFLKELSYNEIQKILNSSDEKIKFFKNYNKEIYFYEIKENLESILELDDSKIKIINQFDEKIFKTIRNYLCTSQFSFKNLINLPEEDLIFLNENLLFFEKMINIDINEKIFKNKSFKEISPNFYNIKYNILYKFSISILEIFRIENKYNNNLNSFYLFHSFFNQDNYLKDITHFNNIIKFISNKGEEKFFSSKDDLFKFLVELLKNNIQEIKRIDISDQTQSKINLFDISEIKKIEVDVISI